MYQNWPSKTHQLPFDQGVQIVIPPRSPASVPEPITNQITKWQYFASIAPLRLVMITSEWFSSRFMHPRQSFVVYPGEKFLNTHRLDEMTTNPV